jgi:hypothetical protein
MEKIKSAISVEAKEASEIIGHAVNSGEENVEQKFQVLQSDDTAGVQCKEDDKDKRLELLDTIAEVQRKYLEIEEVRRPVHTSF